MHDVMGRKVETAVEARAGFLDSPVLVVLTASIVLVTICFVLIFFGFIGNS